LIFAQDIQMITEHQTQYAHQRKQLSAHEV